MRDITNTRSILTEQEMAKVRAFSARIEWGFTRESIRYQIAKFAKGDEKTKAKVYYLLEDCNFHTLARLLADENYAAARLWVKENM